MEIISISQVFYGSFFHISIMSNVNIAKAVGENLKQARLICGITQKQIAAELKKGQADYSDYETGKIQLDYEKIVFLCKRFGITPNDLFDFD